QNWTPTQLKALEHAAFAALGNGVRWLGHGFLPSATILLVFPLLIYVAMKSIGISKAYRPNVKRIYQIKYPIARRIGGALVIAVAAVILRPLLVYAAQLVLPSFAFEFLRSVLDSPAYCFIFVFAFTFVITMNLDAAARIEAWKAFSLRLATPKEATMRPPVYSFDWFLRFIGGASIQPGWIGMYVLPVAVIVIAIAAAALPFLDALQDILHRVNRVPAQVVQSTEPNGNHTVTLTFPAWASCPTGIVLEKGVSYEVQTRLIDAYDGKVEASENKVPEEGLKWSQRWARGWKRLPKEPYFRVCGGIGSARGDLRPLRSDVDYTPSESGELYLILNDVPGFDFNNKGTVEVTLTASRPWELKRDHAHSNGKSSSTDG
ncbi:MAG: hypothetical protein AAFV88_19190, partial [Planctomycetota bacterium]